MRTKRPALSRDRRKVGLINKKKKEREKDHKDNGKMGQIVINTELNVSRSFFYMSLVSYI